ncbi:MAG: hypothetical protein HC905_09610 [Bacteroidales bacterium]|nr:hypothetical protein [Bacteroidales bacterium]
MKKPLILFLAILFVQLLNAQKFLTSKEDLTKHSEKVVLYLKDSKFEKAFGELQEYWPLPENELIQLESQTIKQFNMVSDRFGKIIGTDFIKEKTIKDYVVRNIYVIRFEKHMIRILFTYYKNDNGWILNGFKWDDQFDDLFD